MSEFTLPNLGDGVAQGDVLRVLVKPGDTVAKDQPVLELETDKATVEVPINVDGTVKEVRVKPGDKVKPGQAVLTIDDGERRRKAAPAKDAAEGKAAGKERRDAKGRGGRASAEKPRDAGEAADERQRPASLRRRRRRTSRRSARRSSTSASARRRAPPRGRGDQSRRCRAPRRRRPRRRCGASRARSASTSRR